MHKKPPQRVWDELAVTGALPPPKTPGSAPTPAAGRLQAAELEEAMLDTAAHRRLRLSFVPHSGIGGQGGQRGLPAPCRKPCLVLASLTPSYMAASKANRAAELAWLHLSPACGLGNRQGSARCSRTPLCCRWTEGTDSRHTAMDRGHGLMAHSDGQRAWNHGTQRDKQPDPGHCLPTVRTSPARSRAGHHHPTEQPQPKLRDWGGRRAAQRQIYFKLCQLV